MWHTNIRMIDPRGTRTSVFPTRAYFTGSGDVAEVADFTDAQHLQVIPKGVTVFRYPGDDWKRSLLVGGAAGDRACDRWLHEGKLWNPARAIYSEIQGKTDREEAQREDPSTTFDGGPNDYRHLQDEADKALDEVWPLLQRGLAHFDSYAEYTGDRMCELLGIVNNPSVT